MKIFLLCPFLKVICNLNGISTSEAQRRKEKNKNDAEFLLQNLQPNVDRCFSIKREILTGKRILPTYSECDNPHTVKDFDCLEEVQNLYAESAIYGCSLGILAKVRKDITEISNEVLAEKLGISKTFQQPVKNSAVIGNIEYFCNMEKIEDLIPLCDFELLRLVSHLYKEGLEVEAKAAVLGNQYTKKNSLLRRASVLSDEKMPDEKTDGLFVFTTRVVAIDKESFKKKGEEIAKEYTELQQRRNSIMKQIKDAARELELKYNHEYQAHLSRYHAEVKEFESMVQGVRLELLQELSSLKIAI